MRIGANVKISLPQSNDEDCLVLQKNGEFSYLEHLVKRLRKIPGLEVFLTASPRDNCEELKNIANKEKLAVFFDAESDHHRSLINAAENFGLEAMLDIPANFTTLSINHTTKMIDAFRENGAEITVPINFPAGTVPLSIISDKALEKISAAKLDSPYYEDYSNLPEDISGNNYKLDGRRTFFETPLILNSKEDIPRIDYILKQNPQTIENEKALYDELNIQDKYEQFFQPFKNFFIEPTNHCNLRCPCCVHGSNKLTRQKGYMTTEDFKTIISRTPPDSYLTLFGLGEPFMNKNIYQMINSCGTRYTYISTNGHFFHSEKNRLALVNSQLNQAVFAIDGISEETYAKYRKRGMFSRMITDIKELIKLRNSLGKKTPRMIMQFVIFNFNEHEMDNVKEFAASLGMDDVNFKTGVGANLSPKSLTRQQNDRKILFVKGRKPVNPFQRCLIPMVFWNGDMTSCCYFPNNDKILGNLVRQSLEEIKSSAVFEEFARKRAALEDEACARIGCYCYS